MNYDVLTRQVSKKQYEIILDYMEKNGDISIPGIGLDGKVQNMNMWQELVKSLNAVSSGSTKTERKWRIVWSGMKTKTKLKYQKFKEALKIDPDTRANFSDREKRVLPFICKPNINYAEADSSKTQTQDSDKQEDVVLMFEILNEDDDKDSAQSPTPEDTTQPEESAPASPMSFPSSSVLDSESPIRQPSPHPQESNDKHYGIADALIELNRLTRENESNRDIMMYKLEMERLRQRDLELKQQAQLLSFLNSAMKAVHSYLQTPKN